MSVWHSFAPLGLSRRLRFAFAESKVPRRITCRALRGRMEGLKESDQRGRLRRTQVVSVGRHIASALDYLPDELVLREPHCDAIQGWPPLSARIAERVAVAALLHLKHQRTLPLECGCAMYVSVGHWLAAPGIHARAPGRELGHASKGTERDGDHEHGDDRNRRALPTLLTFSGKERQENQANNY